MKTPEGRLKDAIKRHLTEKGAYFFMPVQTGYGRRGVDIFCCVRGLFVAIETKAPGKKPNPTQKHCLQQVRDAMGIAFWCDSFESYRRQLMQAGIVA